MAAEGKAIDALSQFELSPVLGFVGKAVGFSQANLFMLVAVLLTMGLLVYGMRQRAIVPGRLQSLAETSYEFVHELVTGQVGDEGKRFSPLSLRSSCSCYSAICLACCPMPSPSPAISRSPSR